MTVKLLPPVTPAYPIDISERAKYLAAQTIEHAISAKWTKSQRRTIFAEILSRCLMSLDESAKRARIIMPGE